MNLFFLPLTGKVEAQLRLIIIRLELYIGMFVQCPRANIQVLPVDRNLLLAQLVFKMDEEKRMVTVNWG